MSETAAREHLNTDKGSVPVYTTAIVEQRGMPTPPSTKKVWRTLFRRQREVLVGRACDEFFAMRYVGRMEEMCIGEEAIPKFAQSQQAVARQDRLGIDRREGLLPELDFFEHLPTGDPGDLWIPHPRAAGLPVRAGPLPRPVRPRAAADEPGVRRLHAGLLARWG